MTWFLKSKIKNKQKEIKRLDAELNKTIYEYNKLVKEFQDGTNFNFVPIKNANAVSAHDKSPVVEIVTTKKNKKADPDVVEL